MDVVLFTFLLVSAQFAFVEHGILGLIASKLHGKDLLRYCHLSVGSLSNLDIF